MLFREGSDIALNSKPKDISDEDWNYVNRQACGTIRLCLAKDQKYFVMKETMASSLWKKLEDKYMTKSIENRLYLKKKLFRFQYKKVTGRAAVSSNSDDEASDTSRLWHMRLGHVGEKNLQGLVKQGRLKGAKTEALMYASHIVNRLPASALDGKTPKEVWSGQPVSDYDQLHIFGSPAYFHVTESKLDPRAKKAIFVGFSEGVKGFRLWNPESKKIILSRDVTFDESAMLKQIPQDTENENPNSLQQVEFETPKKSEKVSPTVDHPDDEFDDQDEISVEVEDSAPVPEIRQQPESIATSRHKRDIRRPARYKDMVAYALPPEGFKVPGCENWACKLNKSLYGLKQSPRQWYKWFDSFMMTQKYTRSHFDHCVYFRKLQDGTFVYLLLYVDDMLIASKSKVEIDRLKAQLSSEFDMKDLGEAKKILGMEIKRDRAKGTICLTQTQYLKTVLQRFGIDSKSKPVLRPPKKLGMKDMFENFEGDENLQKN
ncbi:hypothetical protein EZV62_002628 [Acer yangbiense]|uniref:Reverse transcriptase Ty1/copia-type domain-containing protein n=1 Tax=Acer yangbiense TaxID=1000413 RepID=A0A5C7IY62_9ROSI|nr:hypothetical protein EZV62_002628 [Acer yangbiense]